MTEVRSMPQCETSIQPNELDQWKKVLQANRVPLLDAANTLLSCVGCGDSVVRLAEERVASSNVPDPFKYTYAMRVVVKESIAHIVQCRRPTLAETSCGVETFPIKSLPVPERIIYFLRENLKYSRRDASLLLGTSDEAADRLLHQARLRLGP